ncbi:type I toxin-antitoxin system Fst family toxin [Listeria rocourtiae]
MTSIVVGCAIALFSYMLENRDNNNK